MRYLIIFTFVLLLAGCKCPIESTTFAKQKTAIKSATESAASATKYWKNYDEVQQERFLKANQKAWEELNRVYNPPQTEQE